MRQVVYASGQQGRFRLRLLDWLIGRSVPLTSGPGEDVMPAWCGQMLVFASNRRGSYDLYLKRLEPPMGADEFEEAPKAGEQRITADPAHEIMPALSRDGRALAFASDRSGNWDIYLMHRAHSGWGEPVRLTSHEADDLMPSFSLDGKKIVFSTNRYGNFEICTIRVACPERSRGNDSDLQRLTHDRAQSRFPEWFEGGIGFESYQPGQRTLELFEPKEAGRWQRERLFRVKGGEWFDEWMEGLGRGKVARAK